MPQFVEGLFAPRPIGVLLLLAALATVAVGCSPTVRTHGNRLDEAAIAQIQPGATSRAEVERLLGSPSSLSTFDDSAWYYVSQRTETRSFYQSNVVGQDVVAIEFDERGVVQSVDRHGMEQARAIDPVSRTTRTAGNELTVLEQFIGNLGRFNLPQGQR